MICDDKSSAVYASFVPLTTLWDVRPLITMSVLIIRQSS